VFLLDVDEDRTLYLWLGKSAPQVRRQKASLFCEKGGAGSHCQVTVVEEGDEDENFCAIFEEAEAAAQRAKQREDRQHGGKQDPSAEQPAAPLQRPPGTDPTEGQVTKLHEMRLGDGFLELPQVVPAGRELRPDLLRSDKVYILDDYTDVIIWVGRRSSRLVRAAAARVAHEIARILPRPAHFLLSTVTEGTEPLVFKSKFSGWDDIIQTDYRARDVVRVERGLADRALLKRARGVAKGVEEGSEIRGMIYRPRLSMLPWLPPRRPHHLIIALF
jgi:hypothetical protein